MAAEGVAANQGRILSAQLEALRPYLRNDQALPSRIQRLLARDKRLGSRDRRLYRELIYTAVRYLPWIEELTETNAERVIPAISWLAAESPATRLFRSQWIGALPPTVDETIAQCAARLGVRNSLFPDWCAAESARTIESPESEYMHRRAHLWLRVRSENAEKAAAALSQDGWTWSEHPEVSGAWRLHEDRDVTKNAAYENGWIEIQDVASQALLLTRAVNPGEHWFDACAGAGGKTLQLAELVQPGGRVTAHDIRPEALAELKLRVRRAGLSNVSIASRSSGSYDGVLVDAPCSGSGTWRRSPHLKWTTSQTTIAKAAELQRQLLDQNASLVRAGGLLIYATCSLCQSENEAVARHFLETHPEFSPEAPARDFGLKADSFGGVAFTACRLDSDAFYVAGFRKNG